MDTENTEVVATPPIAEDGKIPCDICGHRVLPQGMGIHKNWAHDERGRKAMMRGARKGALARLKKHRANRRIPKLIGDIPDGSKLRRSTAPDRKCAFCDKPPLKSESGLRYHLAHDHGIHHIEDNRAEAAKNKNFAKPPKQLAMLNGMPKPLPIEVTSSEVVATIEVVRIGSEVYGRITEGGKVAS